MPRETILHKSHFISEVVSREYKDGGEWSLIFLIRSPIEAISSQISRSTDYRYRWVLPNSFLSRIVDINIEHYIIVAKFFLDYQGPKYLINFKDLFDESKFIALEQLPEIHYGKENLLSMAKKSQFSRKIYSSEIDSLIASHPKFEIAKRLYRDVNKS